MFLRSTTRAHAAKPSKNLDFHLNPTLELRISCSFIFQVVEHIERPMSTDFGHYMTLGTKIEIYPFIIIEPSIAYMTAYANFSIFAPEAV
jgi:hypothetical protein